jgi:hypothetical protein
LRPFPASILAQCYDDARSRAVLETRLLESAFPELCPFRIEDALDARWLPSAARHGDGSG